MHLVREFHLYGSVCVCLPACVLVGACNIHKLYLHMLFRSCEHLSLFNF